MEDSVNITEQPEAKKAPVTSVEMVRHQGTDLLTKRIRGKGGKFVKQDKPMPKAKDLTRMMRNILNSAEPGFEGKITKGTRTRFRVMFENILKNACMNAEQPVLDKFGNPVLDKDGNVVKIVDPKIMMAAATNFKEIMLRTYGQYAKSDDEIEALKTSGVKVVVLAPPPELMNKEVKEDKPREKLVPAFIDAEIVTNKE